MNKPRQRQEPGADSGGADRPLRLADVANRCSSRLESDSFGKGQAMKKLAIHPDEFPVEASETTVKTNKG